MAASLIETHRLYARMVAQVQPSWIESAGAHLVKRTYGDAEWDPAKGLAFARETVSLYGRVLQQRATRQFRDRRSRSPRIACSSRRRWCAGSRRCRLHSSIATMQRRSRIEQVEACLRRRDLLAGDESLVRFYIERIPPTIASTRAFERWWRGEQAQRPHMLDAPESVFLAQPLPAHEPSGLSVATRRRRQSRAPCITSSIQPRPMTTA